jgi:hypothetical protein
MELKVRIWRTVFPEAWVSCVVGALLALGAPVAKGQDQNSFYADPCMWLMNCNNNADPGGQPNRPQGPTYDPCYLAQNALRPCTPEQRPPAKAVGVDPNIVGTWELPQKGGTWVLEIHRDGTYRFHSEAGDGVAPNAGTFSANNGRWSLSATNGYADGGTYLFQSPDTWIATGKLGTAAWRHRGPRASVVKK